MADSSTINSDTIARDRSVSFGGSVHNILDNRAYVALTDYLKQFKALLLSNLIMLAETPAPVGKTSQRAVMIATRLSEYDLLDISIDEMGNVIALFPGEIADKNVVLLAHLDTHHSENMDHTVQVHTDSVTGIGLTDNSISLATLMSLPYILKQLQIQFRCNIILCFSANSLDSGDLQGTRFFLENSKFSVHCGICLEGFPLGRISYMSIGLLRGMIEYDMPDQFDWTRFGAVNAIVNMNGILNRILEIPLPSRPRTSIVFNTIHSGVSYNVIPSSSVLQFEVRSESNDIVEELQQQVEGILSEMASMTGAHAALQIVSRRNPGGLHFSHPMVKSLTRIQSDLDIETHIMPSTSDLAAFIDKSIPAVTLGLTKCERYNLEHEKMYIDPCFIGITQLLALISEIDRGNSDE